MLKRPLAAVTLALALAACGAGSPDVETVQSAGPVGGSGSATPSATIVPTADPGAAARQYLEAFASGNATKMAAMLDLSEPGSAAHTYGQHQRALAEAIRAGGGLEEAQTVTVAGDSIEVCFTGVDPSCGTFSDFQALPTGKLTSFTVDGTAIESRLLPAAERPAIGVADVSLRVISAYRTIQSDSLIVTLDVSNQSSRQVTVATYDADYVTPDGRQAKVAEAVGLTDVQAGASTFMAVVVPAADHGGTLSVDVFTSDFDTLGTVKIPVA